MSKPRKPSPKAVATKILERADDALLDLYIRMCSHIPFEITEEMALATLVNPDDVEFVRRSKRLYSGVYKSGYGGGWGRAIIGKHVIDLSYDRKTMWFVPTDDMIENFTVRPEFIEAVTPWLQQVEPIYEMWRAAVGGLYELRKLCGDDPSRVSVLWPAIGAVAQHMGSPLPPLPNPRGLPATPPDIREMLLLATTFVNSAMLMPETAQRTSPINLSYSQK